MAISLTRMGEDGSDRLMALCMVIFHEIDIKKKKLSIRCSNMKYPIKWCLNETVCIHRRTCICFLIAPNDKMLYSNRHCAMISSGRTGGSNVVSSLLFRFQFSQFGRSRSATLIPLLLDCQVRHLVLSKSFTKLCNAKQSNTFSHTRHIQYTKYFGKRLSVSIAFGAGIRNVSLRRAASDENDLALFRVCCFSFFLLLLFTCYFFKF